MVIQNNLYRNDDRLRDLRSKAPRGELGDKVVGKKAAFNNLNRRCKSFLNKYGINEPITASFFAGKGGVGKTVTALAYSQCLAVTGLKVIIFDLDIGDPNIRDLIKNDIVENPVLYKGIINLDKRFYNESRTLPLLHYAIPNTSDGALNQIKKFIAGENIKDNLKLVKSYHDVIVPQIKDLGYDAIVFDLSKGILEDNAALKTAVQSDIRGHVVDNKGETYVGFGRTSDGIALSEKKLQDSGYHQNILVVNRIDPDHKDGFFVRLFGGGDIDNARYRVEGKGDSISSIAPFTLDHIIYLYEQGEVSKAVERGVAVIPHYAANSKFSRRALDLAFDTIWGMRKEG